MLKKMKTLFLGVALIFFSNIAIAELAIDCNEFKHISDAYPFVSCEEVPDFNYILILFNNPITPPNIAQYVMAHIGRVLINIFGQNTKHEFGRDKIYRMEFGDKCYLEGRGFIKNGKGSFKIGKFEREIVIGPHTKPIPNTLPKRKPAT